MNDFQPPITSIFDRTRLFSTLIFLVLFGFISSAQTTITWEGNVSADWHDAANWSSTTIPTMADSVVIPGFLSAFDPIVMNGNTAEANSVNITFGGFLNVNFFGRLVITESTGQGIRVSGSLNNNAGGEIFVGGIKGISVDGGTFSNRGTTFVTNSSTYSIEVANDGTVTNQACGNLRLSRPINNSETFINNGLMGVLTTDPSIFGSLTNNGIIEHTEIPFPASPMVTNDGIIIDFTTFTTSGSDTILNAFQVGASSTFVVTGVFLGFGSTMPAGTYNDTTNTFILNSNFPFGITTVAVLIEDSVNSCIRQAGWLIDKRCDFIPNTFNDKLWNVDGPDSLWSNPYNWCPFGVPQPGEGVQLPATSNVYYDGGPIFNSLDNRGSLTVMSGSNLRIENQTDRSLLINTSGSITNLGVISLTNGQRRGILNQPDGIIDNFGVISVDNVAIAIQEAQASLENRGEFTNHSGASISLTTSNSFGFENDPDASFINQTGASLLISDIDSTCLLYTSPSPRDLSTSRMPSSA